MDEGELILGILAVWLWRTFTVVAFFAGVVLVITGDANGWWLIGYAVVTFTTLAWRWARS
jgi:hypothetical protein